jgi:hypothetical protein
MKKFYLFFVFILILTSSLFAQRQGISLGGNVYFPIGDWAEYANIGYGASATYEHPLGRNISGVLYSGYTVFSGDEEGTDFNWTMIPLVAGAKFYFSPKLDWYIGALLGVNFVTAETTVLETEYSASSTEFAGNVNFGYEIKTSDKGAVDISAGFIYINEMSYFGMRLAYIFKL